MPNTQSAKKALRSSKKKRSHNLFWKNRFKKIIKSLNKGIDSNESPKALKEKLDSLQKMLDKSAKEKVIHKNKANRLKSKYAKKIAALDNKSVQKEEKPKAKETKSSSTKKTANPKSK